ncbi:MAG: hypothetical protein HY974_02315 [Candidatus Kerfeldbacteria bacterium]|nr:hypothetical protein [Candidatus Kerfeldbacteria bacterium]
MISIEKQVEGPGPVEESVSPEIARERRLRDEAWNKWRFRRGAATDEQLREIDRAVSDKKFLATGAKLVFGEEPEGRLQLTPEQLQQASGEWRQFVKDISDRYVSASDEYIENRIAELAKPGRKRKAAEKSTYEYNKMGVLDREQQERAALKEILKRRKEKADSK